VMHQADAAMYRSKEQGGDRYTFYSEVDVEGAGHLIGMSEAG
jgi:hypothetical protein